MSVLKFAHAADLHLDSEFEALTPEKAQSRREGQREILFRLTEQCIARGARALLLSGDVFEKDNPSPETQRDFQRALASLDIPVFVAPGNHDNYFPGSIWDRMNLPQNVHVFKSESFECVTRPELNARFWGAAFEGAFAPPLLCGFAPPEKVDGVFDIMVLHGDLNQSEYCHISRGEIQNSGMDYLALGHIHARSGLERAGKTAFCYPGCPEGRGFDETGEKGFNLVTLSRDGVNVEFVPLGGVQYEILLINISGENPVECLEREASGLTDRDYVRVILRGNVSESPDLAEIRRAFTGRFAEFQLRDETELARNPWERVGEDSLEGLFLQKLKTMLDSAVSDEEKRKIELAAEYGIKALQAER